MELDPHGKEGVVKWRWHQESYLLSLHVEDGYPVMDDNYKFKTSRLGDGIWGRLCGNR